MCQRELLNALKKGYVIARDKDDGYTCLCNPALNRPFGKFFFGWTVRPRSLNALINKGLVSDRSDDADCLFYHLRAQLCFVFARSSNR